jgi:hypothetical protein
MKVILSRKSMDSKNGGIPSPVLKAENGEQQFYPLPIPYEKERSNTKFEALNIMGHNLWTSYMKDVKPNYRGSEYCHLDPDLRKDYLSNRHPEWKRAFGQVSKAQAHLEGHKIAESDVFLFFGWFQFAELSNGKFRFIKDKYPNGFHAIYGYLQVGEVYNVEKKETPEWLADHPHVKMKGEKPFSENNNTVYVGRDSMDFFNGLKSDQPGAGCFAFDEQLILTEPGHASRTMWKLPAFLHPSTERNWCLQDNHAYLKSASIGQEFVFKDNSDVVKEWCLNLIKGNKFVE